MIGANHRRLFARPLLVVALLLLVLGLLAAGSRPSSRVALGTVAGTAPVAHQPAVAAVQEPPTVAPTADGDTSASATTDRGTSTAHEPGTSPSTTTTRETDPAGSVTTTPTTLAAAAPQVVQGRVTDEWGNPIPHICFIATTPQAPLPQSLAETDASGRYRIERDFWDVTARACDPNEAEFGWDGHHLLHSELPPGPVVTQNIVLDEMGGVRGVVVDAAGAPVVGICIAVPGQNDWSGFATESGADGRFSIRNILPGTSTPWAHDCAQYPRTTIPVDAPSVTVRTGQWSEVTIVVRDR